MIVITGRESTGEVSAAGHFNANFLPGANSGTAPWGESAGKPYGVPTEETSLALDQFEVEHVRFPAGQGNALFADEGIIVEGDLAPTIRKFLTSAQEQGLAVNFVVPVESLEPYCGMGAAELYEQLEKMSEIIAMEFPGVVAAYELGNEYWVGRRLGDESRETEYGEGAAQAALALNAGMQIGGEETDLILQAAGNLRGSFNNDITEANKAIQEAFESFSGARELVDGILRNFYWRDADEGGFQNDTGLFREDRGLELTLTGGSDASWENWVGKELKRLVGEYNINKGISFGQNPIDLGVHGASFFLEHYTNLVAAGVDIAFVWSLLHNTRNALLDKHEDIETTEVNGIEIVKNSTRAAMFDVLRQTVVEAELVDLQWTGGNDVEVTAFEDRATAGTTEIDVFISSRSSEQQTIVLDLTLLVNSYTNASGIRVFYELADGHHRNADISELDCSVFNGEGLIELTLRPYEVVGLNFENVLVDFEIYTLSDEADKITTTDANSLVHGLAGDDVIASGNGRDRIDGGIGEDRISSGHSSDTIDGGEGSDWISAGPGRDSVTGGLGRDSINGGNNDDTIEGGGGSDLLVGGGGNDLINGGWGADLISGGVGNDTILAGSMNDIIRGGFGTDSMLGGPGDDHLFGETGTDVIRGGTGYDRLEGGLGDDELHGGWGNDKIFGGTGNDCVRGGRGKDTLNGGSGDDVLTGGAGSDLFIFRDKFGQDRITDFEIGEDIIRIRGKADDVSDLTFTQSGNAVIVSFTETEIVVNNATIDEINNLDNFLFG